MAVISIGYIGINTARIDDWSTFAARLLGMQQIERSRTQTSFRMDDRKQRLIVRRERSDGLGYMGFEVSSARDLHMYAERLETHGVRVTHGAKALTDERYVSELISFTDPAGNAIELFYGPALAEEAFRPGRPISGFRTGSLGMGHVVLHVERIDLLLPFYRDILGFRVSDYGLNPYPLYFFHLNNRHHNFALVGSGSNGIHHFMVELNALDDVGQGYDLAQLETGGIAYTLGRHTNDHITSFYANTPSGFFVEYGWGGRSIDPARWIAHETTDGPSLWGHDRLYDMPESQKIKLREMRLSAAARGIRAPDYVGNCAWLDSVIHRE